MRIEELETRVRKIEVRNQKVEVDKAWETSLARKILIIIVTYVVIGLTFTSLNNPEPWINAIIPALGFFLSTLTISYGKNYWVKHVHKV